MHLILGLLFSFGLYRVDSSFAASGLFDDGEYDPSSFLDNFSNDQTDLGASFIEDPTDFSNSPINNQEDLGPLASNDQLDWDTEDQFSYLDDSGSDDINFQQDPDPDFLAATPSCTFDAPGTQGLHRKKRDNNSPNICPNPSASDGVDPIKPPDPADLGLSNGKHADLYDFYLGRDQETIQGYFPTRDSSSPCGTQMFTVCDSGDPYYRIPQVPPRYALERCFVCMFDSSFFLLLLLFFMAESLKERESTKYPSAPFSPFPQGIGNPSS